MNTKRVDSIRSATGSRLAKAGVDALLPDVARTTHPARPRFLALTQVRMPVGAWTSIGHRASGVLLAAAVPVGVFLLDLSLRSAQGFAQVSALFQHMAVKALAVIVVWALAHHLLAGVRHLLSDFNQGSPLRTARRSAWAVNAGGVAIALLAAGVLL